MDESKIVLTESNFLTDQEIYTAVRGYVIAAQNQIYSSVNIAMVTAYWNIGKQIYEACGENDRAAYGKQLLRYLSEKLTEEFGKGFDERNLRNMRQFYLTFPIRNSLRSELSWTHYRALMKVKAISVLVWQQYSIIPQKKIIEEPVKLDHRPTIHF